MNRAKLIAWAKSQGATAADCASVESLTKWFEASGYDPANISDSKGSKSLAQVWDIKPQIKLADDPAEAAEEAEAKSARAAEKADFQTKRAGGGDNRVQSADKEADDKREKGGLAWTPAAHQRASQRKAYNAKAYPGVSKPAYFDNADQAEISGALVRLRAMGPYDYAQRSADEEILRGNGIDTKANIGTTMTSGGATFAGQFDPTLIDLKNNLTVAQELVGITPMMNDTWTGPRRTGGLTVYAPGQGSDITESNPAFDQVTMTATQMWTLTTCSLELLNDSALNFIAHVGGEIKFAFDAKIEDLYINGDGTSTYFSYNGLRNRLLGLSATRANIAGLAIGQGDLFSEITMGDLEAVTGLLPAKWDPSASWLMHKRAWVATCLRLSNAAGGVIGEQFVNGISRKTFLGYPVALSDSMPRYTGTSTDIRDKVTITLGDHRQGSKIGVVNGSASIATSDQRYFEKGVLGIRGGYRAGILVHDVGNATSTEADKAPGPIVGLLMKAS